jgi:outer membrane protein
MSNPPEERSDTAGKLARRILGGAVIILALLAAGFPARATAREVVVGVLADGPMPRTDALLERVRREVAVLMEREHVVRFPPAWHRDGGWSRAGIEAALDALLAAPAVDVVLTSGLIGTHLVAQRETLAKPVIGMVVADAVLQAFPRSGEASGKANFTYIAGDHTVGADLAAFHRLVGYRDLAIIADRVLLEALPELPQLVAEVQARLDVRLTAVAADTRAADVLARLPATADAVYVPPLPRFDDSELAALAAGLVARDLPSYTLLGREYLAHGFLMSGAGHGIDEVRTARRVALDLQAITLGEAAATLPVALAQPRKLAINLNTAEAIDYAPRWEDLEGAVIVARPVAGPDAALGLVSALERALEANLQLRVSELEPLIANADQAERRAALLPQLGLAASARAIDGDRANPLFAAEHEGRFGLEARQLVYSEQAWAGFHIARYLREAADAELRTAVLDVLAQAARAYLAVLLAEAAVAVRESNVALTEANLERAAARAEVGQSGRAETLRWRSELAIDRQELYRAEAEADQAMIELKRLLALEQDTTLALGDSGIPAFIALLEEARYQRLFDNARRWAVLRDFHVERALARAPELARLDALVDGAERQLLATGRAYYVPDVSLVGQAATRVLRGGRGASLAGTGRDDDEWAFGVEAELPLFLGGARDARRARARYELTRTTLSRADTELAVRARMLDALARAGGSYPAIRLSREAEGAARENLAIVTDAYAAGSASITELNDAQDAALTAGLAAARARYAFMLDFVAVLRAAADFDVLLTPDGLETWYAAVDEYFRAAGAR